MNPPIGWQWCPGARGICHVCKATKNGLWQFYVSETTSTHGVCSECADLLDEGK